jgi:hypothetical protein
VQEVREPAIEALTASDFFTDRQQASSPPADIVAPLIQARETVPEPLPRESAPVYEEDLDVPAYLRQGKLLN